jgi:uncharacterized protein (TIGR00251 family)
MNDLDDLDEQLLEQSNSIRDVDDRVFLDVEITPNSAQPGIKGYNRWRDRLMIKLRSQAKKGKANIELIKLLSNILNIELNQLNIIKGEHSTQKTLVLTGLEREVVIRRIFEAFNE